MVESISLPYIKHYYCHTECIVIIMVESIVIAMPNVLLLSCLKHYHCHAGSIIIAMPESISLLCMRYYIAMPEALSLPYRMYCYCHAWSITITISKELRKRLNWKTWGRIPIISRDGAISAAIGIILGTNIFPVYFIP